MTYSVDARGNQNERNKYESKRLNTTETNINNRNKNQRNERLDILKSAENKEQKYKRQRVTNKIYLRTAKRFSNRTCK